MNRGNPSGGLTSPRNMSGARAAAGIAAAGSTTTIDAPTASAEEATPSQTASARARNGGASAGTRTTERKFMGTKLRRDTLFHCHISA